MSRQRNELHKTICVVANGTAAIVEFPGMLYRGDAEKMIREYEGITALRVENVRELV